LSSSRRTARVCEQDLALALRLVDPENQAVFFANLGREAAKEVRAEMVERGPVPVREAEAALSRLLAAVRALEEAGEVPGVHGRERSANQRTPAAEARDGAG
jgi:flagellar motor switch protein FliG